ncbi:hNH endonuclease, partial [Enterobacter hormaechei]|nr:hNH endonuclease [Enterobacter hormaechei]
MKMNLIEMEGFLRGKCLPGDIKTGESNAEYLVRKFSELHEQLSESQREFRSADATIENLQMQVEKLAAESSKTSERSQQLIQIISNADNEYCMCGDAMKNHAHGGCGHPTGMFDYHYNQW